MSISIGHCACTEVFITGRFFSVATLLAEAENERGEASPIFLMASLFLPCSCWPWSALLGWVPQAPHTAHRYAIKTTSCDSQHFNLSTPRPVKGSAPTCHQLQAEWGPSPKIHIPSAPVFGQITFKVVTTIQKDRCPSKNRRKGGEAHAQRKGRLPCAR